MYIDSSKLLCNLVTLTSLFSAACAILCYQCDSNEDDTCPSDRRFNTNLNALVDCSSFEAHVPGQFCMKVVQRSPGWWGWEKVTRRCGSQSDIGVAWGCRWEYVDNGVFKETCYCQNDDGCNGSSRLSLTFPVVVPISVLFTVKFILW